VGVCAQGARGHGWPLERCGDTMSPHRDPEHTAPAGDRHQRCRRSNQGVLFLVTFFAQAKQVTPSGERSQATRKRRPRAVAPETPGFGIRDSGFGIRDSAQRSQQRVGWAKRSVPTRSADLTDAQRFLAPVDPQGAQGAQSKACPPDARCTSTRPTPGNTLIRPCGAPAPGGGRPAHFSAPEIQRPPPNAQRDPRKPPTMPTGP